MRSRSTAGCGGCPLGRREFIAGCMTCVAGLTWPGGGRAASAERAKPKVRLVFTHITAERPTWPHIGYDYESRKKELSGRLRSACPDVEFLPATAKSADDARKLLEADREVDGYLVYMLGLWTGAPQAIAATGRPTLFVDDLYGGSGEFLIANAAARRAGQKVSGISTSRFEDVAAAARCFRLLKQPGRTADDFLAASRSAWREGVPAATGTPCKADPLRTAAPAECLARLRESKILVVGSAPGALGKAIEEFCGTRVLPIEFAELNAAYERADADEAAEHADSWMKAAEKTIEPPREEIVRSARMYLAERELMKRHDAQAISINCLGGFYGGHIKAYPCLGFSELNSTGSVGACEADLVSTLTMLAGTYLSGRPGYISDPVIDTAKNQIIYAHCVAPTRVFGPEGAANPYHIRSHSEYRRGAVLRSILPLGYMTTTVEIHPARKEMVLHQGRSVENIAEDKACRTKLAVEVEGDIEKLMLEWDRWGWHRVTFYGDLAEPLREVAGALKVSVIEEA